MSSIKATLTETGRIVDNYVEDATTNFDSTTQHQVIVPANRRWLVMSISCRRDANATLAVSQLNASDKQTDVLCSLAAGTGIITIPNGGTGTGESKGFPRWLDSGSYIQFNFGAAQGATATIAVNAIEVIV